MFRHGLRMSEACQDETWPGGHRNRVLHVLARYAKHNGNFVLV